LRPLSLLGGISFFSFSISEESIEQLKDMGFILLVKQLNILQAAECFGVNLHTGLTDEIVERDFQWGQLPEWPNPDEEESSQ
jgi:hypothetical protein